MVRPKLSFDKEEDRIEAVRSFIRRNVASIDFIGVMRGMHVVSIKVGFAAFPKPIEGCAFWNIEGTASIQYALEGNVATLEKDFDFSCGCNIVRGEDDAPVVTDLKQVIVSNKGY